MIPENTNGKNFTKFLKLPNPMSETPEGDIKAGDTVTILEELHAPESDKIKSPLIGEVSIGKDELGYDIKKTIGINWTSYFAISPVYGEDTASWIGKKLKYIGLRKTKKGAPGHLWEACE